MKAIQTCRTRLMSLRLGDPCWVYWEGRLAIADRSRWLLSVCVAKTISRLLCLAQM